MDGFLNVLKPSGVTSHDIVLQVRRIFNGAKAGHLGTLDPMARGVLPVALGRYTRLSEYLLDEQREYLVEFVFGISTDTCDLDGQITFKTKCDKLKSANVLQLLSRYIGKIEQSPPAYSAVQVKGERLYNLARRGVTIEIPQRIVNVSRFELLHWKPGDNPRGVFRLLVGRGTYVRSIARDLGKELGCGATVSFLLRTRVGRFHLKDSLLISDLKSDLTNCHSRTIFSRDYTVLGSYPIFEINPKRLFHVAHGRPLKVNIFQNPDIVENWITQAVNATSKKARIFIGGYTDIVSNRGNIACVLSAAADENELYVIKYEKVLIRGGRCP